MKKKIVLLLFLSIALCFSCTNLDDVNSRLDNHEKRLSEIEAMVNTANGNIQNLKSY